VANLEISSKRLDTSSKCSGPPSWKLAAAPPGRLPDLGGPSTRRFQRIGERDVVPIGEEAHRGFWVAFDVVPECFAETCDDVVQILLHHLITS